MNIGHRLIILLAVHLALLADGALAEKNDTETHDKYCDPSKDGYMCNFKDSCGRDYSKSGYIYGGMDIKPKEHPSMVQIMTNNWLCSGVIVSDYHVLTSERCLLRKQSDYQSGTKMYQDPGDLKIIVGTNQNMLINAVRGNHHLVTDYHQVKRFCFHPLSRKLTSEFDVVLLQLNYSLSFTDYIQPACWPYSQDDVSSNNTKECWQIGAQVVGVNAQQTEFKDKIQKMKFKELNCDEVKKDDKIGSQADCVASSDKSAKPCHADFGGPGLCLNKQKKRWYLKGVKVLTDEFCVGDHYYLARPDQLMAWMTVSGERCAVARDQIKPLRISSALL